MAFGSPASTRFCIIAMICWSLSDAGVLQNGHFPILLLRFIAAKRQPLQIDFISTDCSSTDLNRGAVAGSRGDIRPPPASCGLSSTAPAGSRRPRSPCTSVCLASVLAAPRCTNPRIARARTRRRPSSLSAELGSARLYASIGYCCSSVRRRTCV